MLECPFPFSKYPVVTMAHGAGGRFTRHLIDDIFSVAMETVDSGHDGALFDGQGKQAFTTDSYVVSPIFFPGGDIGKLAVIGTCNDLAVCAAEPGLLSCGWIIEEGVATESLFRIAVSMADAAREIGARIVTGDTKVVERGHGDQVYINTAGVGQIRGSVHPEHIQAGDVVIVSGDLGRHGVSILTQREDLQLQTPIVSDCAHLWPAVETLIANDVQLHCLRDLTRGGLATALWELAEAAGQQIIIERGWVPVTEAVGSVCEIYGLDPLYIANEGCMVVIAPVTQADLILSLLGGSAAVIGRVKSGEGVVATTAFGSSQILDPLSGEQLPRIC